MKKIVSLVLALCMVLCCAAALAQGNSYKVGVLQLIQHVALDDATRGFQDALTEALEANGDTVEFTVQNASGESANCAIIANGFVSDGVDLIMANATPAVQAAVEATPDIPVLGTSVTDYATALGMSDWTGVTGINLSGTSDLAPLDGQAAMINELFPDAKTIGMVYCSAEPNSIYQVNMMTEYLTAMGYECVNYAFTDSNDVAAVVTSACASDVIYIPTDNTAANVAELIGNEVLSNGTPVVAGEEGICSGCGVATLSISYYDLGYATGKMAYEVLANGVDVTTMPIEFASAVTKKFNRAFCEQLNITVPEDYVAVGE